MSIGEEVTRRREEKGWSVEELATMARMSRTALADILERMLAPYLAECIDATEAVTVAAKYDCTARELYMGVVCNLGLYAPEVLDRLIREHCRPGHPDRGGGAGARRGLSRRPGRVAGVVQGRDGVG